MGTVLQPHDRQARAGASHAVGAGIGFALAAAFVGLTSWERQLRVQSVQEAAAEPIWVLIGLYVLAGAIAAVVLLLRRTPWVPTAASVSLLYYLLASIPVGGGPSCRIPTGCLTYSGPSRPSDSWSESFRRRPCGAGGPTYAGQFTTDAGTALFSLT
jgi:hypothetical protein